jgi:spermidine synthase
MPNRRGLVILITLVVSFCSISYELLLAQALSAFLENTVLRYSVTIGLYLFALGLGARAAEGRMLQQPVLQLLKIETALTLIGGFLIVGLYGLDNVFGAALIFSAFVHGLILMIGFLSGMELPLLMAMLKEENSENVILGFSYFGAVIGTFVFAAWFYPVAGLMQTAFIVGALNGCAGVMLNLFRDKINPEFSKSFYITLYLQLFLFFLISACWLNSDAISHYCLQLYLNRGA